MDGVIETILTEINCETRNEDSDMVRVANELAAGVTAEREAEIAESLPRPYPMLESATADVHGPKIRVPRIATATAHQVGDGEWVTSTRGRRLCRKKADCAVGVHVVTANDFVCVVNIVVLWKRVK